MKTLTCNVLLTVCVFCDWCPLSLKNNKIYIYFPDSSCTPRLQSVPKNLTLTRGPGYHSQAPSKPFPSKSQKEQFRMQKYHSFTVQRESNLGFKTLIQLLYCGGATSESMGILAFGLQISLLLMTTKTHYFEIKRSYLFLSWKSY